MIKSIYIDGYIGAYGEIPFCDNTFSLSKLNSELADLDTDTTSITVFINSGGGIVSEGFAIHDKLASLKIPVTTEVLGQCGSIATVIALAPKSQSLGGKVIMNENSEWAIHNPLWAPSALEAMNADDLSALEKDLRKTETKIIEFYSKLTGTDNNVLAEKMKAETKLTPEEAKALGFVDEVKSQKVASMVKYKIAAITQKKNQNQNTMSELKKEIVAGFAKLEKLFSAFKPQTMNIQTKEGVEIFYDGDLAEGVSVFSDEAKSTPAPDGTYTVEKQSITVKDGVVVSIEEVKEETEAEVAKKEIENLKAQLLVAKNEFKNTEKEKEKIINATDNLKKEFLAFKQQVITGGNEIFEASVHKGGEPAPVKDWKTELVEFRKNKK